MKQQRSDSKEVRKQKIAERQNLESRKTIKDKQFHLVEVEELDEEEQIESRYGHLLKGKR